VRVVVLGDADRLPLGRGHTVDGGLGEGVCGRGSVVVTGDGDGRLAVGLGAGGGQEGDGGRKLHVDGIVGVGRESWGVACLVINGGCR
jgi:hypothetical protein